ncbi:T9SS type A sorting domain-containing protein [Paraflavitalea sp. CAU 1676]|uniref:PKD domain-containing protein n=1 Tax=Paraflavitalea sp. CAU 1676 TaxID=3032598 RepID=UPI0023DCABA8|nr:T9SS type A sorting domain-containing protein [Paraflavitalea sp. CAU 1676]MDF2190481.1 T9SS type A sorting domain-containing protein [Paraflavitalea sp. CAU 1676]
MKKLLLFLSMLITLSVAAQHVPKSLVAANGTFIGFYQYTPTNYNANPNTKYPLIIFLHGVSERGNGTTELKKAIGLGVPAAIEMGHTMTFTWNGKTETFIVLTPQLSYNYGGWEPFHVQEMINYAKRNLRIDENRILLTGLSLGGSGVWGYPGSSLDAAKQLAGIGVCCGVCTWNTNYNHIVNAKLPVWAFHAMDDYTVLASCTQNAIASINNLNPAVKPYATYYPTGGHWIWNSVYDVTTNTQNPSLYEWFMAQNKSLPVNKRPVANAGGDINTTPASATVTLNGNKSTDADGKLVRYIWKKLSGPNAGTIVTPVSSSNGTTLVTGLTIAGTYQYELKVVDERCDWTMDTVNVVVSAGPPPANNKAPIPYAGTDITVQQPANQVTLKGSATDPDGSIISYSWLKVSGPAGANIESPNSATTQVTGLLVGDYVFKLIVVDDKNVTASDDIKVSLLATDGRGSTGVNPGPNVTLTLPTNSLTLDGTASYDPFGGKINGWRWIKLSGPAAGTVTNTGVAVTTATGLVEGSYVFQLTTWNSQWEPKSATKIVTVQKGNGNPPPVTNIAKAGPDQTIQLPVNSVTLNGSGSVDPNGPLSGSTWSKLSGPAGEKITNATALTTTVTSLAAGTYQFILQVYDTRWNPSSDTMIVTVKPAITTPPPANPKRIANAGADQTIKLPTNSITLNGAASVDAKGPLKGIAWLKIGGPTAGTIADAKALTTTATGLTAGTYQYRLLVYSSDWVPSDDTVLVTVQQGSTGGGNPGNGNGTITNAGADKTIQLPTNSTVLDGSASKDPTGAIKQWFWKKISGPNGEKITNAGTEKATVSNLAAGTYLFSLTCWGNNWRPFSDTMQLKVLAAGATARTTNETITTTVTTRADIETLLPVEDKLTLYPNPASGQVNVQTVSNTNGAAYLNIYDMTGKLVKKVQFQKGQPLHQQVLNITTLKPGLYQVEAVINNATSIKAKFVKQ